MSIRSLSIPVSDTNTYNVCARDVKDDRSFIKRIIHAVQTLFRECFYGLKILFGRLKLRFSKKVEYVCPKTPEHQWKVGNRGLILCVHGLNDSPYIWNGHIKEFRKQGLNVDIKAPYVPEKGNCSLEQAAKPILKMVEDYIKKHPKNPICLLGVSNGARVVNYVDANLRHKPVKMKISTIAGAHLGSSRMDFFRQVPLIQKMFHKSLKEELAYVSDNTRSLVKSLRKPLDCGTRSYDFYASTEDYIVTPFYSSLPILNQGEKHYVVHGEGHGSIVWRVRKNQIDEATRWFKKEWSVNV